MQKEHRIGRRIYTTVCQVIMYDENNELKEIEVSLIGNHNDPNKTAMKVARMLGTSQVIVKKMDVTSKYYSMTMDTFTKYADKITD